jgi:hypothetical protein
MEIIHYLDEKSFHAFHRLTTLGYQPQGYEPQIRGCPGQHAFPIKFLKISIRVIRKVTLSLDLHSPPIPSFNGVSAK